MKILFFLLLQVNVIFVELPSYGEYNDLFISVTCFLKTTRLSVHRLNSLIFFLVSSKVHPHHFSAVAKTLITATEF